MDSTHRTVVGGLLCFLLAVLCWTAAFAREVAITILATTDLHGHILPTSDYDGNPNLGGLARCATVIRQVRQQEKNVLLVDAGDTFQGTAVSWLSGGRVMVKLLNELRYDAWVLGNHEFDWGLEKLAACVELAEAPILNANLHAAGESSADDPAARILARTQPFVLRELDGVKVAIIGLNTPGIPNWSRPRLIRGLRFADSVETLKAVVPAVRRAGAQVIILVCHQGYREAGDDHANQIKAIAYNFPELDVIIGGHTHRNFPEYKLRDILYCQPGYHGIHLGRVDLVFDTATNRVTQRKSNTLRMDERIAPDRRVLELAGEELDRTEKLLATVVGEALGEFTLRGAPRAETPIHNLIFDSIAAALKAEGVEVDAIVHGILGRRATLSKGPVSIADIWQVVPYENTIGVAQLTPGELIEILEENAAVYRGTSFRGIWGLRWVLNPDAPAGRRTISLRWPDGTEPDPDRRLAVAFNSYELASGGLRWQRLRELADRPEAGLREYDLQTRQAVIDHVRAQGQIAPVVRGWWKAEKTGSSGER
jgi:2',3'-cyclic-nucleotide 2'-phosphodiesterase (5'-nucleotidase family)